MSSPFGPNGPSGESLDNWITGHYGQDQYPDEEECQHGVPFEHECELCSEETARINQLTDEQEELLYELEQGWKDEVRDNVRKFGHP